MFIVCEDFQSGFRPSHITEIALFRVTNDLLLSSDHGCISLLVLLDLIAAFDFINHNILLNRLENFVGISGSALARFKSYLSDHHQFVAVNKKVSYRSSAVWSTSRLSTRTITFHALHVTLGKYHQETRGLAFTVVLMLLKSIFLHGPVKHTKLRNLWKKWMTNNF